MQDYGGRGKMKWPLLMLIAFALMFSCEQASQPAAPPPATKQQPVKTAGTQPSAAKKAAPAASAEGMEDVIAYKAKQFDYSYNPIGKRDPFKPYEGEVTYFEEREKTPLEMYDLSQFTLTAIVWGISEPRALVRAPDGQDYIVKKDMRIGKNLGRIARITKKELVVAEEYRDPLGKLVVKETPMLLHEKAELDKLTIELQ
jgi:type IV pilus assembly protein PilP